MIEPMPCSITDGIQYDNDREMDFNAELNAVLEDITLSQQIEELRFGPESMFADHPIRLTDFFAHQAE